MMFCLRSFLPLLLLPLPPSLSPIHLVLLLALTYVLNRPCIYCSFLLCILFTSSCYWSDRCFIDFDSKDVNSWFEPRIVGMGPGAEQEVGGVSGMVQEMVNSTAGIVVGAAVESAKAKLGSWTTGTAVAQAPDVVGLGWLRSLLGKTEWTLPCVNVKVRL